jgi:hypothetical protein
VFPSRNHETEPIPWDFDVPMLPDFRGSENPVGERKSPEERLAFYLGCNGEVSEL